MKFYLDGREATLSDYFADDLQRAVINSLFCWRRADESDDYGDSRSGWWADTGEDEPLGSRLWLLQRAKLTESNLRKAQEYAEEALKWLVDDGIAESVSVECERDGVDRLNMKVTVIRADGNSATGMRFEDVWGE